MDKKILQLLELNYQELDRLNRYQTVFLLPLGPPEEHGPHLPLGTDVFNSEYFASELASSILSLKPDFEVVLMPTLSLGTSIFRFPGSLKIRQRTLRDLIVDYCSSLACYGFKYFLILNAHGGIRHLVALEEACRKVSRKYKARMYSLTGKMVYDFLREKYLDKIEALLNQKLSPEEKKILKYDYHAGRWETSMMLKIRPDLVKQIYKNLEPVEIDSPLKLTEAAAQKLGNKQGYFGYPSLASKEFAEATMKVLKETGLNLVLKMLEGGDIREETTPFGYRILFFRTDFKIYSFILPSAVLILILIYFILR